MTNINNFKIFFIYLCIISVTAVDLSKYWTVSCSSIPCRQGLDLCISSNCLGARQCKAIIDEYYPACSLCANEILDTSQYELVNGNYHLVCNSGDDLHVKACLFYCRVNWYPYGECVRQNYIPICKCGTEPETTATTNIPFTTSLTTPLTSTTTVTATAPFTSTTTASTTTTVTTTTITNGSLLSVFSNLTIQSTIIQLNGNSFSFLFGFGMRSSSNTVYYYVTDIDASTVYILNDEWKFSSIKTFTYPTYMITIENSLYMTGWPNNVWKVDQDLNILINHNPGGNQVYRGISYNPSNGLLYVVAWNLKEIQVFNLDLTLIRSLSTSPHDPFSITESANKLYVGTYGGMILVYQNEEIINQFNGCNGYSVLLLSILFDKNGYIATSCDYPIDKLYLYAPNGSFTGKSLTSPTSPRYIGFDSKGRFFQISSQQISVYN